MTSTVWIQEVVEKVNSGESEVVLDFSSVLRVDGDALSAIEDLARLADERSVKIVLRAVNSDVYRVLKLMNLTQRFRFVS